MRESHERRAALITAGVTDPIDGRDAALTDRENDPCSA